MSDKHKDRRLKMRQEFEQILVSLIGMECWSCTVFYREDTTTILRFGEKLFREIQDQYLGKARYIPEESTNYYSKTNLLMRSCFWRISDLSMLLCTSENSEGYIDEYLLKLVGQKVENAKLIAPNNDLAIVFSNSLTLQLFCRRKLDTTDKLSYFPAYEIYTRGLNCSVRLDGSVGCSVLPVGDA